MNKLRQTPNNDFLRELYHAILRRTISPTTPYSIRKRKRGRPVPLTQPRPRSNNETQHQHHPNLTPKPTARKQQKHIHPSIQSNQSPLIRRRHLQLLKLGHTQTHTPDASSATHG